MHSLVSVTGRCKSKSRYHITHITTVSLLEELGEHEVVSFNIASITLHDIVERYGENRNRETLYVPLQTQQEQQSKFLTTNYNISYIKETILFIHLFHLMSHFIIK